MERALDEKSFRLVEPKWKIRVVKAFVPLGKITYHFWLSGSLNVRCCAANSVPEQNFDSHLGSQLGHYALH